MKTLVVASVVIRQASYSTSSGEPMDWEAVLAPLFLYLVFLSCTYGLYDMWRTAIANRACNPTAIVLLTLSTATYAVTIVGGASALLTGKLY
ncbi:hypothetical protein COU78_05220 [Candidatus Peregrinibacteria bacterium CG10_big_fil_rev_8_21_14_0_10_49_24]|nr:MAG: hypothetical protein COV83_01590 [Candidatus Peregrinibacteria bacterium CG11_big_fil_rev_8_21_14_0_20_49_14]PIR50746.1 MAG: hypothetical protein COU78_05220 [Candidatus Peregrinibacteria bacterium CG10_big_fil_rev_8_21_14_0_10_49_24]PJA68209.1 MAG: hypothetical protein CO157_00590 [Candidatus Peregrinibacteria bacterium CG_4_9_14_3_um_filter_49_12]